MGHSYVPTLEQWRHRFNDRLPQVQALGFDETFIRMWNFYLTSCAASFRTGTTDVSQVTMQRPA